MNLLLLGFPVLNFASRETMANEPRTGRDRVLAISGSQSPRFSHIERINYISRRGPVFAARGDADELPKDRGDRVLAIRGSRSPSFFHIERINYISRPGPFSRRARIRLRRAKRGTNAGARATSDRQRALPGRKRQHRKTHGLKEINRPAGQSTTR